MCRMNKIIILLLSLSLVFNVSSAFAINSQAFDGIEQQYLSAYGLVRQAFEDKSRGDLKVAFEKFSKANMILQILQKKYPEWHGQAVAFLKKDCIKQLEHIRVQSSPQKKTTTHRLVAELRKIQDSRARKANVTAARKKKKSIFPSISRKIFPSKQKKQITQKRKSRSAAKTDKMYAEKFKAIEAAYHQKKKESDQWNLQYSILEEKTREEIQTLSSEFANEKNQIEIEIKTLTTELKNSNTEKIALTEKNSTLERALKEAQRIKTKTDNEVKAATEAVDHKVKTYEVKLRTVEQKLTAMVRDQALREEKITLLEKKITIFKSKENQNNQLAKQFQVQEQLIQNHESEIKLLTENNKTNLEEAEKEHQVAQEFQNKLLLLRVKFEDTNKVIEKLNEEKEFLLAKEKEGALKDKEIAKLHNQINDLQFENKQKEVTLRKLTLDSKVQTARIKNENEENILTLINSFNKEKKQLSTELTELKTTVSVHEKDMIAVKNLKTNKTAIRNLKTDNAILQTRLREKESAFEQLELQQIRSRKIENLLENSEIEKKQLYEDINRMTSAIAQMRLDQKRLEDINLQLRQSLARYNYKSNPLTNENLSVAINQGNRLSQKNLNAIIKQVKIKFKSKDYQAALNILDNSIQKDPKQGKLYFYQGLTYTRLKKWDQAIHSYEKATQVSPNLAKAYNNLGNIYSQQKKYGKAIENLKRATALDSNLAEAYNNMGIVYSHLGQFDEAIKSFIHSTDINPNLVAPYFNLGQIYFQEDKLDAAHASFEKVLVINPKHEEAKQYIAQIKTQKGYSGSQYALDSLE